MVARAVVREPGLIRGAGHTCDRGGSGWSSKQSAVFPQPSACSTRRAPRHPKHSPSALRYVSFRPPRHYPCGQTNPRREAKGGRSRGIHRAAPGDTPEKGGNEGRGSVGAPVSGSEQVVKRPTRRVLPLPRCRFPWWARAAACGSTPGPPSGSRGAQFARSGAGSGAQVLWPAPNPRRGERSAGGAAEEARGELEAHTHTHCRRHR